jgi:F-type H+-transporting ATPase subunit alpha
MQTGVVAIAAMIPVGHGQREWFINDHAAGKTTIAIDTTISEDNANRLGRTSGDSKSCPLFSPVAIGIKNSSLA